MAFQSFDNQKLHCEFLLTFFFFFFFFFRRPMVYSRLGDRSSVSPPLEILYLIGSARRLSLLWQKMCTKLAQWRDENDGPMRDRENEKEVKEEREKFDYVA